MIIFIRFYKCNSHSFNLKMLYPTTRVWPASPGWRSPCSRRAHAITGGWRRRL